MISEYNHNIHVITVCAPQYESGDGLRVLPCAHRLHIDCIDRWYIDFDLIDTLLYQFLLFFLIFIRLRTVSATCPTCRKEVFSKPMDQ